MPVTQPTRSAGQGFPITGSQVIDTEESVVTRAKQSQFHKEMRAKQEEARRSGTRHIAEAEAYRQAEIERQRMAYEQEVEVVSVQARQRYEAEKPSVLERYRTMLEKGFRPRFMPSMRIESFEDIKERYVSQNLGAFSERLDVSAKQQIELWKTQKLSEFQPNVPSTESISFWMQYNRPEWAYKYEPFETPEGYYPVIRGEHPELGLDIVFMEKKKQQEPIEKYQPSISDYLSGALSWGLDIIATSKGLPKPSTINKALMQGVQVGAIHPFVAYEVSQLYQFGVGDVPSLFVGAGIGIVGGAEAFAYPLAQFAGFKTPRIPESTLYPFMTGDWRPMPIGYYGGTVISDFLIGKGIGKSVGYARKAVSWVSEVSGFAESPTQVFLTQKLSHMRYVVETGIGERLEPVSDLLPQFRGSALDKWLYAHSTWYQRVTGGIAKEVFTAPSPAFSVPLLREEIFAYSLSKGVSLLQPFPSTELATRYVPSYIATPEMLIPLITDFSKYEHVYKQMPQDYASGFKRLSWRDLLTSTRAETTLSQLIETPSLLTSPLSYGLEKGLTQYPTLPLAFLPSLSWLTMRKEPSKTKQDMLTSIVVTPKLFKPTMPEISAPSITPIDMTTPFIGIGELPKQKQPSAIKPLFKVSPIQKTVQIAKTTQATRQVMRTPQVFDMPTPRIFADDMFILHKKRKPKQIDILKIGRQKREYPIMTEKQFTKNVLGLNLRRKK
jgi:hypothetical protein